MFVLRLAKCSFGISRQLNHSDKPDGMYISCSPDRGTKALRVSSSPQKISAKMFNTEDEASDFYRDVIVPSHPWYLGQVPVFVVEVQTETKIVIKSVNKDAVRQL
jgi:hypothetical protein